MALQTVTFEVTLVVADEPLMDDHDIATAAAALEGEVSAWGWDGVSAKVEVQ